MERAVQFIPWMPLRQVQVLLPKMHIFHDFGNSDHYWLNLSFQWKLGQVIFILFPDVNAYIHVFCFCWNIFLL